MCATFVWENPKKIFRVVSEHFEVVMAGGRGRFVGSCVMAEVSGA